LNGFALVRETVNSSMARASRPPPELEFWIGIFWRAEQAHSNYLLRADKNRGDCRRGGAQPHQYNIWH
jgi:hypothetical protein